MARILILICILFQASLANAKGPISVRYSESANIFEIMDNVSNWYPGFNDEAYEQYWNAKFPVSDEDKDFFKKYQSLREHHYNDLDQSEKDPLKNRNGFFSTVGAFKADPLAEVFYSSNSIDEAFTKLKPLLTQEEIAFLKGFYAHFSDRYSKLVAESTAFSRMVEKTRAAVEKPGVQKFLSDVSTFYGVKGPVRYDVLFVWWPPISRTNASPTGNYLVMRLNPIKHAGNDDTDIIFHEVVHTISTRQTFEHKQRFTEEFLKICDVSKQMKKLTILEEPLAVANGQMLYQARFQPKRFDYSEKWYNNPWISVFAKLIFPSVKEYVDGRKPMDLKFIRSAAKMCAEVKAAAEKMTK